MNTQKAEESCWKSGVGIALVIGLILVHYSFNFFRKIQAIEIYPVLILLLGGSAILLYGYGLEQNDQKAFKGTKKSAEQGNREAQFKLGICYRNGEGVPKSYLLAYMWIYLSKLKLEKLIELEGIMTKEQINNAQNRASEWKDKK